MPHQDHSRNAPDPLLQHSRLRHWWQRALCVLARAEQRIMENFRVPPHGG